MTDLIKIKMFDYQKKDGTVATRTVLVIHETDEYYRGLDFKYLTDEERDLAQDLFRRKKTRHHIEFLGATPSQAKPIKGFEQSWKKAWRTFIKANIVQA